MAVHRGNRRRQILYIVAITVSILYVFDDKHNVEEQLVGRLLGTEFHQSYPCSWAGFSTFLQHQEHDNRDDETGYIPAAPVLPFSLDCLENLVNRNQDEELPNNSATEQSSNDRSKSLPLLTALVRKLYESRRRKDRHIAYVCLERGCGGLGDRIRAATTAFYLAIWSEASFSMHIDAPVPIEEYIEGTPVHLRLDEYPEPMQKMLAPYKNNIFVLDTTKVNNATTTMLSWDKKVIRYRDTVRNQRVSNYTYFETTDFPNELFGHPSGVDTDGANTDGTEKDIQVVLAERWFKWRPVLEHNPYIVPFLEDYPYMGSILNDQPLRTHIFMRLFLGRATPYLRSVMEPVAAKLRTKKKVVGMHLRIGGMTLSHEGWRDPVRHGQESVDCFVQEALRECKAGNESDCAVFYTSDSPDAMTQMANDPRLGQFYSLEQAELPLTHMDKTPFFKDPDSALARNARTWADWYILAAYSDKYLISRSGYSEAASWLQINNNDGNGGGFLPALQMGGAEGFPGEACHLYDFRKPGTWMVPA